MLAPLFYLPFMRWNAEPEPYEGDLDDPDSYPVIDLGAQHRLEGLTIIGATMEQLEDGRQRYGCLIISFVGGRTLRLVAGEDTCTLVIGAY